MLKHWFAILLLTSLVIFSACEKHSIVPDPGEENPLAAQFFQMSPGTDPEVAKVVADMRSRSEWTSDLAALVRKNGFPIWNKTHFATDQDGQGIFLIPLQPAPSTDISAFITSYKHGEGGYTYRLYNKGDMEKVGPLQGDRKTDWLKTMAVFAFFEQSVNAQEGAYVNLGDERGFIKNASLEFSDAPDPLPSARTASEDCSLQVTIIETFIYLEFYVDDEFSFSYTEYTMTVDVDIYCPSGGGGGGGGGYGGGGGSSGGSTGNGGPIGSWYGWWVGVGGNSIGVRVLAIDRVGVTDVCLQSVIDQLGEQGHARALIATYQEGFYTGSETFRFKYVQDNNLVNAAGNPIPGQTSVNYLGGGSFEVVIRLNRTAMPIATKEYVAAVILHEICHGVMGVKESMASVDQHRRIIDLLARAIARSLVELFPSLSFQDAFSLGLSNLEDVIFLPGTSNIDPVVDAQVIALYFQDLATAISTYQAYFNGSQGTPC
jgi:hypothetical protein